MTRLDRAMRHWKLANDRLSALGRRRRSPEYQRAAFWVAMWGSFVIAQKGIQRFPPGNS